MLGNRKIELRLVKDDKNTSAPLLSPENKPDYVAITNELGARAGKALLKGAVVLIVTTAVVGVLAHAAHNAIDLTINN